MPQETIQEKIKRLNCCIILPTFNNAATLKRVIDGVLEYSAELIVVNDGSTDGTSSILDSYKNLTRIDLAKNAGKGNALRLGFKKALDLGFDYAITLDSDGQHYPDDIPLFIEDLAAAKNKNLLLIGARNLQTTDGVPGKNGFGNKVSNFWYRMETGIRLTDTQSGFRLYPLQELAKWDLHTDLYVLEIEVIVKADWNGTEVRNIPIRVLYDPDERVSHFRPFTDVMLIIKYRCYTVIKGFWFVRPTRYLKSLKKKGIKKAFLNGFLGVNDSPHKKALSVALGVFIGLTPLYGFHTVIVLALAIVLKLNKIISVTFSHVSLPPFIPFVLFASIQTGNMLLGHDFSFDFSNTEIIGEIGDQLQSYIIGSLFLSTFGALFMYLLSLLIFSLLQRKKLAYA